MSKYMEVVLPPKVREPLIRRALDGTDIYVIMTPEAMAANPAYLLALRAVGCFKRDWGTFFRCAHWLILFPLGVAAGVLGFFILSEQWTLMMVPVGLVYYVYVVQSACNVARELQKRRQFLDLLLVPYLDPLELGAGLVFGMKYERGRVGAAALAFAAAALLGTGLSRRIPFNDQLLHLFSGAVLTLFAVLLARKTAVLREKQHYISTYREIQDLLGGMKLGYRSFLPRWMKLWAGTFLLVALCWFGVTKLNNVAAELASMVVCGYAYLWLQRSNAEPSPEAGLARRKIAATLQQAV